jgi:hypothetical protein
VSSFLGLFNLLKWQLNISASEIVSMMDTFPELALQNRRDLMKKKIDLIRTTSPGRNNTYMRNFVRRHPDLMLSSYSSMVAKINYLKRNININLSKEPAFPLLLHYNYSTVLWPRCEVLLENNIKHFNLVEVLSPSDAKFCEKFGIDRA